MFWILLISSILWCIIGFVVAVLVYNKTFDDLLNKRRKNKSENFLYYNMDNRLFMIILIAVLTLSWPWFVAKMGWKKYSQWYDSFMFEEKK